MRKATSYFLFALLFQFILINPLMATGLSKSVLIGPKAVGMGGAFVGIADDVTAIFHNPAGISQLEGHNFFIGADGIITDLDYTPPGGAAESAKREFIPVPSFGYVKDVHKNIHVGFGLFFPHGNGGKFSSPSAVISNPTEGRIFSMELIPSVAFSFDNGLSFGGGLRVIRVSSGIKGQLLPIAGGFDTIDDLDVSGWGVGGSAGLFFKPNEMFSFGISYRSLVTMDLDGSITTASGGSVETSVGSTSNSATLEQKLPTIIQTGFGFYPCKHFTFGIAYQFERNSEIESFEGEINNGAETLSLAQAWENSSTIHLGVEARIKPELAIRAGYAKDFQQSVPDAANNRITGDLDAHEVSLGAAYDWKKFNFGLTWNARFGERDVPSVDPVTGAPNPGPGNYDAFVHSINFGLGYKI